GCCFTPGVAGHILAGESPDWRRGMARVVAKETAVLVQMELVRIIINEINDQQYVYLREGDRERSLTSVIGIFRATGIDRRVPGQPPPRPLTHDLLKCVIEALDAEAQAVVISQLGDHTYYAMIRIRKDGELQEVDCRPSDAI